MEESREREAVPDDGRVSGTGVAERPGDDLDEVDPGTPGEGLPVPVVVFDDGGEIRHANEALATELGHERSDVVGTSVTDLWPSLSMSAVREHCEGRGPGDRLTVRDGRADGTDRTLELAVGRRSGPRGDRYVAVVNDVTDLQSRVRRLEQYERIVETIDDGIYILDDAFNIIAVNDAVSELTGYDADELVGANASMLASEETIQQAAAVSEALLSGDNEAATITTTLRTADGGELPVETRFSVYPFGDGSYGQVGVVRDITDRVRYERTLTALHDATRELLHAETPEEVADVVVDAATDVIDLCAAAVYVFDDEANVLRPAAAGGDEAPPDLPVAGPDSGALWESFVTGDRQTDRDSPPTLADETELQVETGTYVPLGDHGVFFVAVTDSTGLDADTVELIDTLAASAEAGLDRVDREQRLRDRDRKLRDRNEKLRRLESVNGVIRRVDEALVSADSREAVVSAVCEELVESDLVSFAWVGRTEGGTVVPEAWAGDAPQYLDAVDRSLGGDGGPPAVRTARDDEATVCPSVAAGIQSEPWRREALSRDLQSAISVPLRHENVTYGVLTVYTGRREGFQERLRSVFLELGATIANALRVAETERWLSADSVVEVDITVDAESSPLTTIAAESGARLVHEGTLPGTDGRTRTFLGVEGADLRAVRDAAADQTVVETVEHRSDAVDDPTVAVHLSVPTLPVTVAEQGSRVRSMTVRGTGIEATVALSPSVGVRNLVEAVENAHGPVTLEARRDRAPLDGRGGDFRAAVRDRLTDRQWQVLRAAYLSGFFEWPRSTTGEEIAETFDLSQPTINRHLRVGERKLLDLLFEE